MKKVQKKNKNQNQIHRNVLLLPLIFILGIIPLIIRYHEYPAGLASFSWFSTNDINMDFFLYYKKLFFLITILVMLGIMIYQLLKDRNNIRFSFIFLPLGAYALFAIISTMFSRYASFGITGIFEQFESVFVLVGYCITVFYAFLIIETEEDIKFIIRCFLYCVIILGVLGILQAIGLDFFASEIGLRTILPRRLWNDLGSFQFKFGKYSSYLTLYNPNYVGVYVAMVAPLFTSLFITSKEQKEKIKYIIAIFGLLVSLYGSKSKAGLIALIIAIILILIFMRKYIFKTAKVTISILTVMMVLTIFLIAWKYEGIVKQVNSFIKPEKTVTALTDIKTEEQIIIYYKGNQLKVSFDESGKEFIMFNFMDENNQKVTESYDEITNTVYFSDPRFTDISMYATDYEEKTCVDIIIEGKTWRFVKNPEDGTYDYINRFGRPDDIKKAESALFTGYESFASGRGYLWSRTIPLLKDHIILGSGADTFALVFPQQDYVNIYNYGFSEEVITKPHNLYLQIWVQTGLLSLIAFLLFYFLYFCSSIRLYRKGVFEDFFSQTGVGIFIGTLGFMITGLTNDSCIAVTPVYWALLGIGIAVNYKVNVMRKQNK